MARTIRISEKYSRARSASCRRLPFLEPAAIPPKMPIALLADQSTLIRAAVLPVADNERPAGDMAHPSAAPRPPFLQSGRSSQRYPRDILAPSRTHAFRPGNASSAPYPRRCSACLNRIVALPLSDIDAAVRAALGALLVRAGSSFSGAPICVCGATVDRMVKLCGAPVLQRGKA